MTGFRLAAILLGATGLSAVVAAGAVPAPAPSIPTLYERLGGVYGIAPLVDNLVDRLLVNETLNANPRFVEFRQQVQKAGLKFIFTASVCHAAGGPEPNLDDILIAARDRVRFTDDEWQAMSTDLEATLDKFSVAADTRQSVRDAVARLRLPAESGSRAIATGHRRGPVLVGDDSADGIEYQPTLYGNLGGWEAIAGIVDVLVERLLVDRTVMTNPAIAAVTTRVPKPGLKYQLTALLCQATGGPEQYIRHPVLAPHARVHVSEAEWDAMLADLRSALAQRRVGQAEQDGLRALVAKVKGEIVTGR